jgi:hypothetical protein
LVINLKTVKALSIAAPPFVRRRGHRTTILFAALLGTMKDAAGAASIITPRCASRPTDS